MFVAVLVTAMNTTFYDHITLAQLHPLHVCEVGVYVPDTSNVLGFIRDGVRTTLVEADPQIVEQCQAKFIGMDHVSIHGVAVSDAAGALRLYRVGASTFAEGLPDAPALSNDSYTPNDSDSFTVDAVRFSAIDDGTIDVLSIDVEGGEWYVIRHMVSRPLVISIETGVKHYTNPFMTEISRWMSDHGYRPWYRDGSDTVYTRIEGLLTSMRDKLSVHPLTQFLFS
ncbi:hypothetical protein BH10BAC6_BH10BAC6_16650 [soil metagenome]